MKALIINCSPVRTGATAEIVNITVFFLSLAAEILALENQDQYPDIFNPHVKTYFLHQMPSKFSGKKEHVKLNIRFESGNKKGHE